MFCPECEAAWQARLSVATELLDRAERIVEQARRSHRPFEAPLS